ncbi:selenium-dependent molybdenum cofactor biosynthesis protein YqeB [Megasphaera cerevisiae]|uniref:selenium-dependent molybdenum cofactor biosynthesis protein YqeB n=1 Tax=Megasphaera cerevisiae TaxID=39029 RepID=UPI0009453CCA|nr:selenium-dependent molybdenum cofactor biosynthesis protein YqeB [Megasphaera cerevisiae]OKY53420.1 hypothetical protein BSR42_07665 [Megasphaera cerevisiae]
MKHQLILVRGGGDIATGTIQALHRAGWPVIILETAVPSAIRRQVALSEAIYDGVCTVEDVTARRCTNGGAIEQALTQGEIPVLIDPGAHAVKDLQPWAVVDAILAKKNVGTTRSMAPHTIALGPGFTAGKDADAVIETMRGHDLGRIILKGTAKPNTGVPGMIAGYGKERVLHSTCRGWFYGLAKIGDMVAEGQRIAVITEEPLSSSVLLQEAVGETVTATLPGLVRGMIRDAYPVTKGFKIVDIDPRKSELKNCFTISDKARCIGGAVVTALLWLDAR